MTCNASFQSGEIKGHSRHNFRDNVGLVADCGAKEISSHLLTALKNGKYLSPLYVSKYIETMSNYMKQPLLENM